MRVFSVYISFLISRVRPVHSFFEKESILENPSQIFTNLFFNVYLMGCRSSFSLNFNAGFPMMSYSARMLVYGKHISSIDEICDYTAYVCFPELSYWTRPGLIRQIVEYDAVDVISSSFFIPNLRGEKGEMFSCTCENSVRISVCKGASYASGELILKPYIE